MLSRNGQGDSLNHKRELRTAALESLPVGRHVRLLTLKCTILIVRGLLGSLRQQFIDTSIRKWHELALLFRKLIRRQPAFERDNNPMGGFFAMLLINARRKGKDARRQERGLERL